MIDDKPYAPKKVGKRLRWLRDHVDLNQEQFAVTIGLPTASSISQWENGIQNLSKEGAFAIVEVYGVTLDWLYLNRMDGLPHRIVLALAEPESDLARNLTKANK